MTKLKTITNYHKKEVYIPTLTCTKWKTSMRCRIVLSKVVPTGFKTLLPGEEFDLENKIGIDNTRKAMTEKASSSKQHCGLLW